MEKMIDSGAFGCVYYPKIDCSGNIHPESKMVSKLVQYDIAKREIYISRLIHKIDNYKDHFLVVESNCTINGKVPFKKCDAIKPRDTKFKILYIPYKEKTYCELSFHSIYSKLLTSVQLLINHKIVHFDINKENIIQSNKDIFLIDFGISIDMTNVYSNLKYYFYTFHIQYYQWPLEVHILCYYLYIGKITHDTLVKICNEYVKHHVVLQKSNAKFVKEYLDGSIDYFSQILSHPVEEIVKHCISSWKTWDNYALIIYLFKMNYSIPTLFFKNIHYLPSERLSVAKCLELTAASLA
jgi:serine/threonine protein kinase